MNNPFYSSDQHPHYHADPSAPVYGRNTPGETPRLHGPQQYSDGVSFWHTEELVSMPVGSDSALLRERGHGTAKHRRTRSGCYTCRSRRVKCDEKKPICDRCLKGGRECIFPEKPPSKQSSRPKTNSASVAESGSSSNDDDEPKILETIVDDEDDGRAENSAPNTPINPGKGNTGPMHRKQSIQNLSQRKSTKLGSETPSSKEKSNSPSTEASSIDTSQTSVYHGQLPSPISNEVQGSPTGTSWAHFSQDIRFYLNFYQENISHHHYFLKSDPNRFIHGEFLDLAVKYEPLLYAIVSFSAFHHTLRQVNGKVQTFLGYYTRSVSKLRRSLQPGQQHHESILLTILQLATFEEYLGDWVNLIGHQRAAHHLLLELFTPKTIVHSDMRRQIFAWYSRFDIVAGLMGGYGTILGREWYVASEEFHNRQATSNPDGLVTQLESIVAKCRTIGVDMATLFADLPRGAISMDQFMIQNHELGEAIRAVRVTLGELSRPDYAVFSFPKAEPGLNNIVDPYLPGGLYRAPYFMLNFSWIDWNAVDLMHKYQTALTLQQPIPAELEKLALQQCRIMEAMEKWPESPPGSLLAANASLGIASLFLPKDYRHTMWLRKKLATMEQMGYIYPPTFRSKMAELWQIPEINHWWLPNDEGYPTIIRSIRSFIEERQAKVQPGDYLSEDLQSMKAIFSKLNIDDPASQRSSPTSGSASDPQSQSPIALGPGQQRLPQGREEARSYFGGQSFGDTLEDSSQAQSQESTGHGQGYTQCPVGASEGANQGRTATRSTDRMSGIWESGATWST